MWDDDESIKSDITVDPQTITFTSSGHSEMVTLSNVDIPDEEKERRLIIVASGTNCTKDELDCNNTSKYSIKRSILIKVILTKLSLENMRLKLGIQVRILKNMLTLQNCTCVNSA